MVKINKIGDESGDIKDRVKIMRAYTKVGRGCPIAETGPRQNGIWHAASMYYNLAGLPLSDHYETYHKGYHCFFRP